MESKSGIFVGLNSGFIVTKPKVASKKSKAVNRKGRLGKRVELVREIIREVAGLAPGVASKEKKAVKVARSRLGTHHRAQVKRDEINELIRAQKKK
ncbi:hypothetical protein FGO68_gene17460 [Halteria grandinella]|uniref:60S ribosomal protein L36 n=1 Tax=Halteria grandinella TaxID=5974 RepID=A0A8J8P201_HALGN|nr:hypothetical protein FGO68_gene17460 [Halteria grandinella]